MNEQPPIRLKRHGRRFYVPATLRRQARGPWILTKSFDEELLLFDEEAWKRFVDRLQESDDSKEKQAVLVKIVAGAIEVDFRRKFVKIPTEFAKVIHLGPSDSLILVGQGKSLMLKKAS